MSNRYVRSRTEVENGYSRQYVAAPGLCDPSPTPPFFLPNSELKIINHVLILSWTVARFKYLIMVVDGARA